jgi:hypothetical protein
LEKQSGARKKRISRTEDRVEELDQIVKDNETTLRKYKHARYLGHHEKSKPMNHGCRRSRGDTN